MKVKIYIPVENAGENIWMNKVELNLPSDETIDNYLSHSIYDRSEKTVFIEGAKYLREQLLKQLKKSKP